MVTDDCEFLGHISTIDPNMWLREQKVLIDQYFFSVNMKTLEKILKHDTVKIHVSFVFFN